MTTPVSELGADATMQEPYVGPRPFRVQDGDKLFGRDDEIAELVALIEANAFVVLYAQSGAGKTSLINAKIIPALMARHCEIIGRVRELKDGTTETTPLRLSVEVPASVLRSSENIFVYRALLYGSLIKASSFFRFGGVSLAKTLESLKKSQANRTLRVVIFDQFEEMFTLHPERWKERSRFFDDIADALDRDPRLRFVFAMREEYVASFDAVSARISERLKTRFRLERLRRDAALEAITGPLEKTPVRFKKGADVKLVENLLRIVPRESQIPVEDEFAEPLHIQLVCQQIWRSLKDTTEINEKMVTASGDVDEALLRYYELVIARILEMEIPDAPREGALRTWFERQLITEDGNNRSIVYRGRAKTNDLPNAVVDALEKEYIIRSEPRGGGGIWYELSHDRFVQPILLSNQRWRQKIDREHRGADLETRAAFWKQQGKPEELLLTGIELRKVREWIQSEEGAEFGLTATAREYIQETEGWQRSIANQRVQFQIAIAILVALVAVAIAANLLRGKSDAEKGETRAYLDIANTLTEEGKPIDALVWALRGATGNLPNDATRALRRTISALGGRRWIERPKAPFASIDLSVDDSKLLSQSSSEVCVWDLTNGKQLFCKSAPTSQLWDRASISRNNAWALAIASPVRAGDSNVRPPESHSFVWEVATGKENAYVSSLMKTAPLRGIRLAKFREVFAVWEKDAVADKNIHVTVYDGRDQRKICSATPEGLLRYVDPTGSFFVTQDKGLWSFWSASNCVLKGSLKSESGSFIFPLGAFDASGNILAVVDRFGRTGIRLFDTREPKEIGSIRAPAPENGAPDDIEISPDGTRLAAFQRADIELYDVSTHSKLSAIPKPAGKLQVMNGGVYATANPSGNATSVEMVDVFSGRRNKRIFPVRDATALSVTSDMNRVILVAGGVAHVFDLRAAQKNYNAMSLAQLRSEACAALQYQEAMARAKPYCR